VKNLVKKLLFIFVVVGGLSVASMAQKDDRQKPPPKDGKPPVINPREKPPPQNPPKGEKPKKPGESEALLWTKENKIELA
jgi:hypothetical protein